jgi:hypothetical protein
MMEQISGGNLLAMRSLATQAKDSAVTTLGNMEALIQHYVALQTANIKLRAELAEMSVIRGIDDRFGGRLALMLECAILNPNGYFDKACALLDEYKAEWEKVNPTPPTFMGEPIPTERLESLREMKAQRESKTPNVELTGGGEKI